MSFLRVDFANAVGYPVTDCIESTIMECLWNIML